MINRFFPVLALFVGVFLLGTFFIGHLNALSPLTTIGMAGVSVLLSGFILRKTPTTPVDSQTQWIFLAILVGAAILLFLTMPDGIYANTCSDVNNHARNIRLGVFNGSIFTNDLDMDLSLSPLFPLHDTPILWVGMFVAVNSIFFSTYPVTFILSALLILLGLIGVFFLAREWFGEKVGLLSFFIASFSVINFFLLSHGFVPQIVGSFCVIWATYFFVRKQWLAAGILSAASISYPPLFLVFAVFVILSSFSEWRSTRKFAHGKDHAFVLLLSGILTFPEIIELGLGRLPTLVKQGGIELIRGGIAVPHPLLLLVFIPALVGVWFLLREKKWSHPYSLFLAAIGVGLAYVFVAFGYNLLVHLVSIQIHRLYMAVKFFYFLLWPLSIAAALGLVRLWERKSAWVRGVCVLLLVMHLVLFVGFVFSVPQPRENFPTPIYHLSDQLSTLPGPFTIGIDDALLTNTYAPPPPYAPFVDNPDNGPGKCPLIEINRLWEFPWARHELDWVDAYFRAVDDQNNWIVKYGDMNVDYFVTQDVLPYPTIFTEGGISVYVINPEKGK